MKYRVMKKIIVALFLLFFLLSKVTFASEIDDCLDELLFTDLRVSAVTTDMYVYLGWFPDEKKEMKEAAEEAIKDLDQIQYHLANLFLPKELLELRASNVRAIEKLKDIYNGIENKEEEGIKQEFNDFGQLYSQFQKKLKSILKQFRNFQELPEDFDPTDEEMWTVENKNDKEMYLNAMQFMKDKKYSSAYEVLSRLQDKYKGSIFEDCINLYMSDCLLVSDTDIKSAEGMETTENGLQLLLDIIDKGEYSPVLYEAFYKWRSTDQYFNHGMSNMSQIPNKEFNEKRWKLIQIIKKHLIEKPNDIWAQKQVDWLLGLPNIARGGAFGNTNLAHWGRLYTDLLDKKEEQK